MKLAPLAIVAVALGALGSVSSGCSHQPPPVAQPGEPGEPPPLPPTSGTPIGHLVDGAGELQLSDDQVGKLKAISDELAGQLAGDDAELRPDPVPPSQLERQPRGLGFHAAGSTPDGKAAGTPSPDNPSPRGFAITSDTATMVSQRRSHHIRDAIRRAFGLLDTTQQVIARRLLTEHGVNPDTGETGDAGAGKLEDPKLGQPLPREP